MRVLHVLDRSLPLVAGYTSRAASILEHQTALGLDPVAVTSLRQETGAEGDRFAGVTHHRTPHPAVHAYVRDVPALCEGVEMAALARRILAIHREAPVDIVHAHSPILCGLPAHAAARAVGAPSVYEIRAFWEDAAEHRGQGRSTSARYTMTRALETRLARSADALVVICEGLRRDLIARGLPDNRIFVVPNGVDTTRFAPRPRDEELAARHGLQGKLVIGYLGTLFRFEGVKLLLDALRRLVATRDDVRGLIIGGGEAEEELRAQHERLGLGDRVVITGKVPAVEAARYYTLIDVLAYPRERHRITDLVTPLKPLEAMSMGKLVVCSDVGGLRELVRDGDTGLLFRAGDAGDLGRALGRATGDPGLRRRAGERARAHVIEHRDWRRVAARYLDVYAAAREAQRRGFSLTSPALHRAAR